MQTGEKLIQWTMLGIQGISSLIFEPLALSFLSSGENKPPEKAIPSHNKYVYLAFKI